MTVKQFKEHIAPTVGITVERQRVIFHGRVLQDEKKLSEFGRYKKLFQSLFSVILTENYQFYLRFERKSRAFG